MNGRCLFFTHGASGRLVPRPPNTGCHTPNSFGYAGGTPVLIVYSAPPPEIAMDGGIRADQDAFLAACFARISAASRSRRPTSSAIRTPRYHRDIGRPLAALAAAAAALALAGCGGSTPGLPACSAGHGRGLSATLAIRQDGGQFTGTYLTAIGGGATLRYDVKGTAGNGRFTSSWTIGAVELPVTGTYTADSITLDDPGGRFSVTRFTKAAGCPS